MPANIINPINTKITSLVPGLVYASAAQAIMSTDVGRLLFKTGNTVDLGTGGSSFSTSFFAGYVAKVDTTGGSTAGSTIPIYYRKFDPTEKIEMDYSTLYSATHPATTDIGKYIGLSTAATVAGAVLSMGNLGTEPGTSDARFLQISAFSTSRRKIIGFPVRNSSVIAW